MKLPSPDKHIKYVFLYPSIIFLLVLGIFPTIYTLFISFHSYQLGREMVFIGAENFREVLLDSRFWNALQITTIIAVTALTVELLFGFAMALILNRDIRGVRFFFWIFLLPMVASPIAVSYIWHLLYSELFGPLNDILRILGLRPVAWLSNEQIAPISIVTVDVWQWTPFVILVLYAALQSLPKEPYEAAQIDGASRTQIFMHITLPLLGPALTIVFFLRLVEVFKIFDVVYGLTGGGPGISTQSITYYTYDVSMKWFSLGYGSALSYFILIIILAITIPLSRVIKLG